ncbi:tetratricopeptide repeat protein [Sinomonas sp. JGH33]|uniref:Tetratricopeptide repeat protein n=1 Tax=Sinomonas terricola TaxID=3110330 RepID=A0ABU5T4H0_9MICC|nr:tetratricopeptide repeat protein [Sinomonas sp. JGH33]MEA5454562.1 tetratricopeptide repeat protein [Sinomonas sp. JGH33]
MEWLKAHRTKLWVGGVALLLVFYLVLTFNRAILLLADPQPIAKAIGAGYLVLPIIGAWALAREIMFGAGLERLGRELDAEGGLPEDNLPRTPGGRIVRAAADAEFPAFQAGVEAAPSDWRSWYRLGLAYDASGDRKRARAAMRRAIALHRTSV